MTGEKITVSPQALAELEMTLRAATEEKCRFIERSMLLSLERAIRAEKTVADLQAEIERLQQIQEDAVKKEIQDGA